MRLIPVARSVLLALATATGVGAFAQSGASAGAEPIIQLPAYPVRENLPLRPPEAWRHGQAGGFEILSNASEAETARFTARFWKFQALFQELFPLAKNLPQLPLALVLCGKDGKFDELVRDAVKRTATTDVSSYFATDADQGVIVVDLQNRLSALPTPGVSGAQLIAGNAGGDDLSSLESDGAAGPSPEQLLNREYIHFMLSRFAPRPPVWFAEGLAQLYSRLEIGPDHYEIANLDGALGHFFTQRQFLPFEKFFAVTYDSPEFLQPVNGVFPAQALALVHLCLYRHKGELQKPLFELIRRANREPVTEKLFREVFKLGYADMLLQLRNYVEGASYRSASVKLPRAIEGPAADFRDATDAEVGRIKGDTLRLAGRTGPARLELLSPYLRGHSDARLLAAIAFLDRAEQNEPVAKKYLTLATGAGVALPGPYIYLAELRLAEMTAPGAAPLTPDQAGELFRLLGAAGAMNPPRADVYRLIAEVWLHAAVAPGAKDLTVLDDALRAFPRDSAFVYAAARAKLRAGQKAEAAALADLGLRAAASDETKRQFAELKAQLTR